MKQEQKALFDLATPGGRQGWEAAHDLAPLTASAEGLVFRATGDDPYAVGPGATVPAGPVWLRIRLKASQSGMGQVFYFAEGGGPSEADSVRFPVTAGDWRDIRLPVAALPLRCRFRIDPPGVAGSTVTVALLDVEPRIVTPEPSWPRPELPNLVPNAAAVRSDDMTLRHINRFSGMGVYLGAERFAIGNTQALIGFQLTSNQPAQWINLAETGETLVNLAGNILTVATIITDTQGGQWNLMQTISPGKRPNSLKFEMSLQISQERVILYLPWLTLLPGFGTFGETKSQALLAGIEYLEKDEPSSSEADIKGPEAQRQVPDRYQMTLPLMAIAARGKWLALAWEPSPLVAACFDSPDRRFKSGGHLMSLLLPGAEGVFHRTPGSLLPSMGKTLKAGQKVTLRATLYSGNGADVTPAIRAYVADKGLPALPEKANSDKAVALLSAGWLDSGIKVGNRYRHAYPGDFGPQPAADAALCQDWLATFDSPEVSRLRAAARAAREGIRPPDLNETGVGHVRTPVALLSYADENAIWESLEKSLRRTQELLAAFDDSGRIRYQPGKTDFGKTHFADHANGLTAASLAQAGDAAFFIGINRVIVDYLKRLRAADALYQGTVPRGAQTWEVPLHTPDILASAHLVRAFARGYELSDDIRLLEAARYWAWTGVPFVYLVPPTAQPVGLYGTPPVLGATNWTAPNWIGLPVQWCGLVYAEALYLLANLDANSPWKRLADGIVVSGLQQTWPKGSNKERQGLLPDSFNLPGQARNDVAINPATLQVPYSTFIGRPMYNYWRVDPSGPFLHAPGIIRPKTYIGSGLRFYVDGWRNENYFVLISGLHVGVTKVHVNNRLINAPARPRNGWLLVPVHGSAEVVVEW